MTEKEKETPPVDALGKQTWGTIPDDNFGYASDEERRAKRGLEDWELVEKMPESQRGVPRWFIGVVVMVLLVAIGLSFPFWGDRPGYEREWINWGFGGALLYLAVFGTFVYFMVNHYSVNVDGKFPDDAAKKAKSGSHDDKPASNNEAN